MRRTALVLLVGTLVANSGCATIRGAAKRSGPDPVDRVLAAAAHLLGETRVVVDGTSFRGDCSGFVSAAYHTIDLDLVDPGVRGRSGTELLYRTLQADGRLVGANALRAGDLLFFHNTWDRNRNGLRDDRFTHVGLVESVEPDGRALFLHFASGEVKRGVMNPRHPDVARDPESGREWNTWLRRGRGKTFTGQLFFRAGRPL